jgi:hypothetical protein
MLHRITRYVAIMLFVCLGLGTGKLSACVTGPGSGFSTNYRYSVDGDLNDWGALTIDANDPNCAHLAANNLVAKLHNTPLSHWSEPLAGYSVALIFAAAVRLGSYGWFNTQPDPSYSLTYELENVKFNYNDSASQAGGCDTGFEGNSCMDDKAGAAAAWGWMAAYKKKRGDTDTWAIAQRSGDRIDEFFNNVCIFDQANYDDPMNPGYHRICNGTWNDIEDNTGKVIAFEHEIESPHYGFGLLTSIAGAITGLEAAGAGKTLSPEQQSKVFGMWAEIQRHINNWYGQECEDPYSLGNGQWAFGPKIPCNDQGYDPSKYSLRDFLINHASFTPPFDQYQASGGFNWDGVMDKYNDHFGYGRRTTYNEQSSDWYVARADQSRYMPYNNNPPQGYLDAISDSGVAYGWACDADAPNGTVKVDFYINGNTLLAEDPSQFPNVGSEPAVNNLCGGGSAHRFFVQLPAWAQGRPVSAWARDYTTGSMVNLWCLESPCVW